MSIKFHGSITLKELEKIEFLVNKEFQPFDITVKMSATFFGDESINEIQAQKMLNINATAALLSYIRPLVSSMTCSSRYPALNIPFIDFTKNETKQYI